MPPRQILARRSDPPPCYITVDELLAHEVSSLKRMATTPWPTALSWWQTELSAEARRANTQGQLDLHLWFEAPEPRAAQSAPQHSVELGAQILPAQGPLVTYYLAIGRMGEDGKYQGLRKLDFDRDFGINSQEPKPAMHSQISGRMCPALAERYSVDSFSNMLPRLDKPRIACLPKSFALLAHLAFLEYQSTDAGIKKLVSDPTWLSVVRAAEEKILQPHFDYCLSWMRRGSGSLLTHFYNLSPSQNT